MGAKVTFNEITKIIEIDLAPDVNDEVFIDVKTDLYSDGKEDWVANENLRKFQFPIAAVGGNPLPGEKALGSTFFLNSDWKIRPYNASHRLIINGNFYSADGTDPFLDTIGTYTVRIMQQVSSLVDSTIQQLSEIEYASFSNGISVDVTSSYSGTSYPVGTPRFPVNNLSDAMGIALERGFKTFFIIGDITIDDSEDFSDMVFVGESMTKTTITVQANADIDRAEFYECHLTGTLDGEALAKECRLDDITYLSGIIQSCVLEAGVITLGGGQTAHFLDCWSGVPGTSTPIIDLGGSGQALALRNYNGGIRLRNKSGTESVSIDLNSGQVVLDDTLTDGDIVIRGIGKLTDNSNGANILDEDLVNPDNIALHVWNHQIASDHVEYVKRILGLVQENFVMDQQVYEDYNGAKLLTSARIRTYSDNLISQLLATYQVTSTWSEGQCTAYQVVKQ
jgi:hypothetical protein